MRRVRRHRRVAEEAELNVTAFLNLMVVLVPFLLISAVFSQVAILEINMPETTNTPPAPAKKDEKPKRKVVVILRKSRVEINDGKKMVKTMTLDENNVFNSEPLINYLASVKAAQPAKLDSTIMLEPDVPYERLIQVMDLLKFKVEKQGDTLVKTELFPVVSIGDAPAVTTDEPNGSQTGGS